MRRKVYIIDNLDCANCAAKMEREIAKIEGVISVNISFLAQKMTLEADDARFDEIAKLAAKACRKVDDECEVVLK